MPHHITPRGNRRLPVFFRDEDYQIYLSLLSKFCAQYQVILWAYCLMPNHVHLVVDIIALVPAIVAHKADIHDRDGAKIVLQRVKGCFPRRSLIRADGGYAGKLVDRVADFAAWTLKIVKRNDDLTGFHVLPRRWVVERTFGWIGRHRRLSKDCEQLPVNSETRVLIAMIYLMRRRLRNRA